jgi:hypothetical protein
MGAPGVRDRTANRRTSMNHPVDIAKDARGCLASALILLREISNPHHHDLAPDHSYDPALMSYIHDAIETHIGEAVEHLEKAIEQEGKP